MNRLPPFPVHQYLAAKHWATWFWLGILRLLTFLPYRWQMKLGRQLGMLSYKLIKRRRHIAAVNISMCFPELDAQQQAQLVKDCFASAGKAIFNTAFSWWASERRFKKIFTIENIDTLRNAVKLGKGVMMLGGHYTTIEIGGRIASTEIPNIFPTYRPARNKLFEEVMSRNRQHRFKGLLRSADLRRIMRAIKAGEVVWYAPDQDFGRKRSVFAPFMGVPTTTLTLTAHIAKATGCVVVPIYSERLADDSGCRVHFGPVLENFPTGDEVLDATRINEAIEVQIRRTPDQYLWLHRRFKTRPDGKTDVYRKKT